MHLCLLTIQMHIFPLFGICEFAESLHIYTNLPKHTKTTDTQLGTEQVRFKLLHFLEAHNIMIITKILCTTTSALYIFKSEYQIWSFFALLINMWVQQYGTLGYFKLKRLFELSCCSVHFR